MLQAPNNKMRVAGITSGLAKFFGCVNHEN
jgi:phage shock protein PspC (stress-responsive transcriptional regulator)